MLSMLKALHYVLPLGAMALLCGQCFPQEDELAQLKKQVNELNKRIEALEKQKAAQPVSAGYGKIKFNGLFQEWYASDTANNSFDTFRNRRLELKLSGQINDAAAWTIMVDPARNLTLRTVKDNNGNVTNAWVNNTSRDLQDAFIEWTPTGSKARLSFGQKKIPVSYEGLYSSAKLLTAERGLYSSVEKMGDVRELGVQAEFAFANGGLQFGLFNGNGQNITEGDSSNTSGNEAKDFAARVFYTPQSIPGLHLGAATYQGKVGSAEQDQDFTGYEFIYKNNLWEFWAEYLKGEKPDGSGSRDIKTYYLMLAANMDKGGISQLVARYDFLDPNTSITSNDQKDFTLGYNRYFEKHNFKWQLNWVRRKFAAPSVQDRTLLISNIQISF